jgi:hypothetical protein
MPPYRPPQGLRDTIEDACVNNEDNYRKRCNHHEPWPAVISSSEKPNKTC